MRFGLFGSARAARGEADGALGYRDFIALNQEAEALGFHSSFLVEHHFTGLGQVSATLNLLDWVAARTSRIRLGTAVLVLPWHNPVLLAEQVATLDLLSDGRLDLGVGRGYRASEFAGFCMDEAEATPRFEEALEVLIRGLSSDQRFSHRGRFWQFEDILIEPPPAQRPHPPIWIAAGSEASIRAVAARGCNLLLDQFGSIDQVAGRIALFRDAVESHGRRFDPLSVAVARNLHVADSAADLAEARARQAETHAAMIALSRRRDGSGAASHILAYPEATSVGLENALYGTPESIATQLVELRDAGARYVLLNLGRNAPRSLRRFAAELMPRFLSRAGTATAQRAETSLK